MRIERKSGLSGHWVVWWLEWLGAILSHPRQQPSGGETLPAPGLTSYLHNTTNSVKLQCTALVYSAGTRVQCRAVELCLFLCVGPRRGVTVWGNHSLSPDHTFSLFLSSSPTPKVSSSDLLRLGKSRAAMFTFLQLGTPSWG